MKPLEEMTAAEFTDLQARFHQGKLKSEERVMLRIETMRLLQSPMTLVSDEYRGRMEAMARSLGVET